MRRFFGKAFIIHRSRKLHNNENMEKRDSFSMRNEISLAEKLRRIKTAIREAESFLEFELALRDLEKVVWRLENQSGA